MLKRKRRSDTGYGSKRQGRSDNHVDIVAGLWAAAGSGSFFLVDLGGPYPLPGLLFFGPGDLQPLLRRVGLGFCLDAFLSFLPLLVLGLAYFSGSFPAGGVFDGRAVCRL